MKYYLLIILFFSSFSSHAQSANAEPSDSLFDYGIFISATIYSFAYSIDFEGGSVAAGASWFFNDELLNFQVGFLFDFRKYYEWYPSHFGLSDKEERTNIFFPIILHGNYIRTRKCTFFLSFGIMPGSNRYLDERGRTQQRNGIPVLGGTGISHRVFKRLYVRASINTQYVDKNFLPAISLDI